jgi:hypothetical protein
MKNFILITEYADLSNVLQGEVTNLDGVPVNLTEVDAGEILVGEDLVSLNGLVELLDEDHSDEIAIYPVKKRDFIDAVEDESNYTSEHVTDILNELEDRGISYILFSSDID